MIGHGALVSAAVNFLIVAFIIYLVVRALNEAVPDKDVPALAEAADVALLRESSGRASGWAHKRVHFTLMVKRLYPVVPARPAMAINASV